MVFKPMTTIIKKSLIALSITAILVAGVFLVSPILVEADKNDKIHKIIYRQILDGECYFDESVPVSQSPPNFPIGWCAQNTNEDIDTNNGVWILDADVTEDSVLSITPTKDGYACTIRAIVSNVGFLMLCDADDGSKLNYVIMNP